MGPHGAARPLLLSRRRNPGKASWGQLHLGRTSGGLTALTLGRDGQAWPRVLPLPRVGPSVLGPGHGSGDEVRVGPDVKAVPSTLSHGGPRDPEGRFAKVSKEMNDLLSCALDHVGDPKVSGGVWGLLW